MPCPADMFVLFSLAPRRTRKGLVIHCSLACYGGFSAIVLCLPCLLALAVTGTRSGDTRLRSSLSSLLYSFASIRQIHLLFPFAGTPAATASSPADWQPARACSSLPISKRESNNAKQQTLILFPFPELLKGREPTKDLNLTPMDSGTAKHQLPEMRLRSGTRHAPRRIDFAHFGKLQYGSTMPSTMAKIKNPITY